MMTAEMIIFFFSQTEDRATERQRCYIASEKRLCEQKNMYPLICPTITIFRIANISLLHCSECNFEVTFEDFFV